METQTRNFIDYINADGSFSYCIQTYIAYNGQTTELDNWRKAYIPGDDISDLPINIQGAIAGLWTPEVIAAWQANHMQFIYSPEFDIPALTIGTAIENIDLSNAVTGGTAPYTFSASGLPAGIAISTIGIISGAPTTAMPAGWAAITIIDANGNTADMPINYGEVSQN